MNMDENMVGYLLDLVYMDFKRLQKNKELYESEEDWEIDFVFLMCVMDNLCDMYGEICGMVSGEVKEKFRLDY